ncbi:hypothetical protein FACS1894185_4290 [Betaproteobacteria bacterium]|nr:hypothetical protein FACS1894185_4290 [Betaproteobacteria bacterium]
MPISKTASKGQGDLILDGFSFTEDLGTFNVDLSLSNWSDATVSVVFKDGLPCDALLAD